VPSRIRWLAATGAFCANAFLATYGPGVQANEDLAKQAQNPVADLVSLPLQLNTNFKIGPKERDQMVLNVQPVYPISIAEDWNLITRTILPINLVSSAKITGGVVDQEPTNEGSIVGLGDTTFTAFFSPKDSGALTWGLGPVLLLPTSTDDALGAGEWGAGLSAVILTTPGQWVVGSLVSNVWTPTEDDGERAVNFFTWQYFVNYNIPDSGGWYLTSAPIITANWESDSDNRWTVPFGGGVGKVFQIGKQPVNGQVSAYYNVEKPTFGASWQLRLQLQFLFPK
jgi:hypothetical protein